MHRCILSRLDISSFRCNLWFLLLFHRLRGFLNRCAHTVSPYPLITTLLSLDVLNILLEHAMATEGSLTPRFFVSEGILQWVGARAGEWTRNDWHANATPSPRRPSVMLGLSLFPNAQGVTMLFGGCTDAINGLPQMSNP